MLGSVSSAPFPWLPLLGPGADPMRPSLLPSLTSSQVTLAGSQPALGPPRGQSFTPQTGPERGEQSLCSLHKALELQAGLGPRKCKWGESVRASGRGAPTFSVPSLRGWSLMPSHTRTAQLLVSTLQHQEFSQGH